jgi:hypothetical protein
MAVPCTDTPHSHRGVRRARNRAGVAAVEPADLQPFEFAESAEQGWAALARRGLRTHSSPGRGQKGRIDVCQCSDLRPLPMLGMVTFFTG